MIQPNELRIGNWLKFKHKIGSVLTIKEANCEILTDTFIIKASYDECEPIPLTPEILEKAGFEKMKSPWWEYYTNTIDIVVQESGFSFKGSYDEFNVKIKYLHQLQNFYFALTGEELSIQL